MKNNAQRITIEEAMARMKKVLGGIKVENTKEGKKTNE